jgi:hypothetical protein
VENYQEDRWMTHMILHERWDHWSDEVQVDSENRIVRNIALAGIESRNGYRYTEQALQAAVPLYESRPVFLDHAASPQRPYDRSARDLVGSITNARYDQGRIRGDIRVLETPSGQTFLGLAESQSPGIGMSHVVQAERSDDGKTVHNIVEVLSVDVVVNPATTSTFRESFQCADSHQEACSPLVEQLRAENASLREEIQNLQVVVDQFRERDVVDQLLKESALPAPAVSACFREQLLKAKCPSTRRRLIDDRKRLLTEVATSPPMLSVERRRSHAVPASQDEFVSVIKGKLRS